MSEFAKYSILSSNYDDGRHANGVHLYLGLAYAFTRKTAQQLRVLDAGCGTGNHAQYLLQNGVQSLETFDANEEMIQKATAKLAKYVKNGSLKIQQAKLPTMPFDDESFDLVMMNQVVHHLDRQSPGEKAPEYPGISKALQEAKRVLKRHGLLIVNMCSREQSSQAFWYVPLAKKANERDVIRLPPSLVELLKEAGFHEVRAIVEPSETLATEDIYYNSDGPLDPAWRCSDSRLGTMPDDELKEMTEMMTKMKAEGSLQEFMMENDETRRLIGQFTLYCAVKE